MCTVQRPTDYSDRIKRNSIAINGHSFLFYLALFQGTVQYPTLSSRTIQILCYNYAFLIVNSLNSFNIFQVRLSINLGIESILLDVLSRNQD